MVTIKGDVATTVRNASSSSGTGFEQVTSTFSRKARGMSAVSASRLNNSQQQEDKAKTKKQTRKGSALKISVFGDGVYYVDASDISTKLNMPLQSVIQLIKNGNFALSCSDGQVPYTPANDNAGLFFFGKGVNNVYTNENIYWLDATKGLLMDSVSGGKSILSGTVKDSFGEILHLEQDVMPAENLTNDPNSDYWYWDYFVAGMPDYDTRDFNFTAYSVSTTPHSAGLTVRLQGISDTSA